MRPHLLLTLTHDGMITRWHGNDHGHWIGYWIGCLLVVAAVVASETLVKAFHSRPMMRPHT